MTAAAAATASRRLPRIRGSLPVSFAAIAVGSGTVAWRGNYRDRRVTDQHCDARAHWQHDHRERDERLRPAAERFTADVVAHAGEVEAGLALGADPAAFARLYAKRRVRVAPATPRHAEVAGVGLDTRRHGRDDGVRRQPDLRRHLPVHHRCHDIGRVGHHRARRNRTRPHTRLFACGAIDPAARTTAEKRCRAISVSGGCNELPSCRAEFKRCAFRSDRADSDDRRRGGSAGTGSGCCKAALRAKQSAEAAERRGRDP